MFFCGTFRLHFLCGVVNLIKRVAIRMALFASTRTPLRYIGTPCVGALQQALTNCLAVPKEDLWPNQQK